MEDKKITYKLKPVNLEVNSVEEIKFIPFRERIIEKHGEVIPFTLKEIEDTISENVKRRKENVAKLEYETAKKENIEHFHPFVKELTPEQLFTAHMYKEACAWIDISNKNIEDIDNQTKLDNEEIVEIKKQIPDLDIKESVESPYVEVVESSEASEEDEE